MLAGCHRLEEKQSPSIYSERFARVGYAALAFDHTSYGDSEGTPRYDEDPFVKSDHIKNAVSFLLTRPDVDPDRLVAVGVCAGGGYVPYTAVSDRRIKAVATVSAITSPRANIIDGFGGPWLDLMVAAGAARTTYVQGGLPQYVPFLPDGPQNEWIENGKQFYLTNRNPDPDWVNRTLLWSYDKLVQYSALDIIDLLSPTPLLIIAGSKAETIEQSRQAYALAREPKELFLMKAASTSTCTTARSMTLEPSRRSMPSSRPRSASVGRPLDRVLASMLRRRQCGADQPLTGRSAVATLQRTS